MSQEPIVNPLEVSIRKARACTYFASVTTSIVDSLVEIETALTLVDQRLDKIQPPHTGRIRLMWIARGKMLRGYPDEKVPLAVAWSRSKRTGLWRATNLPVKNLVRRVKTKGEFEQNAEPTKAQLVLLADLIRLHGEVRGRLAKLDGEWSRSRAHVTRRVWEMTQT